ncbi:MAG: hypothetical protein PHO27_12895 [Sulfuricurvum sp.]|jgi:predicted transcriptional regulator|nr:hypothetical protein [Sulfuricurvum sp.]
MVWNGDERRKELGEEAINALEHSKIWENIRRQNEKIMSLNVKQEEVMGLLKDIIASQEKNAVGLQKVQDILVNGLKKEILQTIKNTVTETYQSIDARLVPLERFDWFRNGITAIRNNLFWIILFAAFVIGLAAAGWEWLCQKMRGG